MKAVEFGLFLFGLTLILCLDKGFCRPSADNGEAGLSDRNGGPSASADYPEDEDTDALEGDEEEENEAKAGPSPVIKTQAVVISVDEGDSVSFPCDVQNAEEFVTVWRNGTGIIYQEKRPLITDTRRVYLNGYALQIANVTRYDSGYYSCEVLMSNSGGPKVSHTLRVKANSKQPAKIDLFQPEGPKKVIEKGQSLSLVCHASGYPQPTVFWSRKLKGSNASERLEGTNYTIPSVNREHSGVYECAAKNPDKVEKQSVEIFVQYEPEVSIKSDTVNTAEGKVSEMHCTVYAEPPASLVWLKEDRPLKSNDHISLYQDPNKVHKHILKIENTKADDFGTYHCIANNTLGATRKSIVLSDNMSNEILQGPLEPNPNHASQLRISIALVLSVLVAMVYC